MSAKKGKAGRPQKYPKAEKGRSAKRFQVAMDPAIFDALEEFRLSQEFEPERSKVIEKLIKQFLIEKGRYPR